MKRDMALLLCAVAITAFVWRVSGGHMAGEFALAFAVGSLAGRLDR